MSTIKKTMVDALAFVTENGNMSAENLENFTAQFCVAKSGTSGASTPREATILRDIDGNQLGRKCTVTGLWFDNSYFSKNTSCVKAADAAKGKLYGESKTMEKEAQAILAEAKDIEDMMEKVAKYESYDAKLSEAKEHRLQTVEVTEEMTANGVETVELLAESMGVEVITTLPAKPAVEETEEVA
jgi:hypothetical protein